MGYFLINEDIVDRNDLTIEEKMACVVLARFADIKVLNALLSLDIISVKMGCSVERSQKAIDGLIRKGVLKSTTQTPSAIIAKAKGDQIPTYVYQALEGDSENLKSQSSSERDMTSSAESPPANKKESVKIDAASVQSLKDYFEEIVSESHVRMLLNLTKGHVEPVKKAYDRCRQYPSSNRIDKVADLLQTMDTPTAKRQEADRTAVQDLFERPRQESAAPSAAMPSHKPTHETKGEKAIKAAEESKSATNEYDALFNELDSSREIKQLNQQINVKRIKQMYGTYGKKP